MEGPAHPPCPPSHPAGARSPGPPALLPWLGLALLLAVQYGLFRQFVLREVAWCYPRAYDQTVYLRLAYECYEQVLRDGPWRAVLAALRQPVANGLVFEAEAGLLCAVLGPSRLTALTLNFAHFALLQVALAATLRRRTGRWAPAFLGVGLLLTVPLPFGILGGMAYFGRDFAAFCLYGVFLCAVARSGAFASRRWSLAAGAVAAWLVLTRYLCAVYLAGAFAAFLGLIVLGLLRRGAAWRAALGRRVGGLLLAGLALAVLVTPAVVLKWPLIRAYYIGHIQNSENRVRALEFGAADVRERLAFYTKILFVHQVGLTLATLAGAVLLSALVLALLRWLLRRRLASAHPAPAAPSGAVLTFLGLGLVVPLAALSLFPSPSPVVGSLMVAPLVCLVAAAAAALLPAGPFGRPAGAVLAALSLAVGVYFQAYQFTRPLPLWGPRPAMEEVTNLYARAGDWCVLRGWDRPRVAVAGVSDDLLPSLVSPVVYERQGVLLRPFGLLGGGPNAVTEEDALAAVRQSEIVIVPLGEPGPNVYPFVRCMRECRPRLLGACRENHVEAGRYRLPAGGEVALFVRSAGSAGLPQPAQQPARGAAQAAAQRGALGG